MPQPSTGGLASNLDAISADGPNDVWIVGTYEDEISSTFIQSETYSLHWNGTAWSIVSSPAPGLGSDLTGATTSNAANDVWAVGGYTPTGGTVAQTLALNWNGTSWVTVPSANAATGPSVLTSVSTTPGASIVQAVGFSGTSGAENPLAEQNG